MAEAAQLKLQVGLDLAFFKQQLALLATTAVGYSIPIEFDRLGVQKEITKLGENIRRRNYRLEIKTNIQAETDKVVKFAQALKDLEGTEINVQITGTGELDAKEARKIRTALRRSILANGGKIKIPATILAAITKDDVTAFTRAAQAKLSEIALNVRADITSSADGLDTKEVRRIRVALHNAILSNGGKIKIPATVVPKIGGEEVTAFQKAVDSKFAGITIKVRAELEKGGIPGFAQGPHGTAGLDEYMRTQGLSGGNVADVGRSERLRKQLEQQRVTQLRGLAKEEGLTGYSKLTKDPLIDKLVRELTSETAERILGNVQNMLRNAGGGGSGGAIGKMLDTFARGLFHMLGMDPAAMMAAQYQGKPGTMLTGAPSPALIGGAPGPFGLLPAAYRGIEPGRNAGALPPAYRGIEPSRNAGALPPAYRGIGPSAEPAGLLPRTTSAGSRDDMMRMLSQGAGEEQPGVLAKTTKARIDEIVNKYLRIVEAQIKQVFDAPVALRKQLNRFSYLVQSLRDAETRTKQMQVPIPMAIGGTAFGSQKLLPSALGNETIKILRDAAHAFLNVMRQEMRAVVYQVGVQDLGNRIGRQAMLPGRTQGPLMLPAAGGTTPRSQMPLHSVSTSSNLDIPFIAPKIGESRKITRGVGAAGAGPGIEGRGMAPPSFQKGFGSQEALAIENAAKQTLRLGLATDIAQRSLGKMNASQIPFVGGLRGIAGELGQATKQVLLYGTAYRVLAAIPSIPGQILNAAKSQQQYTNGLKVATQETGTFAKELLFVDNVQRAFGLNLETTRTGFTRLYASMAPTGFDSGSIEKLFTGISAATAALQLTPDKAERVIYAFGQMASKGQIMSEELKGQLGDVLPGALAIFAKSAGMSVKEFSKAMEDGEFVGNRFREVFAKVSDELMNRFGTGAQAAGKSLQGLLSTVGGDFQRTLESFAPLADSVAQAILVPLGGALRQLSTSAQIAMGEMDRVKGQYKAAKIDLGDLRAGGASADQIRAAEQNVAALVARYNSLSKALEDPAIAKQVKDIQLFTQELTKAGTFVMNVARTIGGILSPAINFLGTNLTATIATITSFYIGFQTARWAAMALMGVLLLYRGLSAMLGLSTAAQQATALSGAFNVLGVSTSRANVALVGTRFALTALVAATVVGAVVAGIVAIASAFATMGDKARDAAQASKDAGKAAMDAASTGNVAGAEMSVQAVLAESRKHTAARKALEAIQRRSTADQRKGAVPMNITSEESVALQGSALTAGMITAGVSKGRIRQVQVLSKELMGTTLKQFGSLAGQVAIDLQEAKSAVIQARKVSAQTGLNKPTPDPAAKENEDTKSKNAAAAALKNQQALADKLSADQTKTDIERQTERFEHEKNIINMAYDLREARANSFQKASIRFQKEMFDIEMKRQESILKADNKIVKAQGSVAGGTTGATGLLQGSTGISSGAHFDVRRQDGGYISPEQARALFEASVAKQLQLTSSYGPRQAPVAGASTFHRGVDLAGPANTPLNLAKGYSMVGAGMKGGLGYAASVRGPQGEMYDVGHLQQPRTGVPGGNPSSRQKKVVLAEQQTLNALQDKGVEIQRKNAEALMASELAMTNYVASIMPTAELQLQNTIQARRNQLQLAGVSDAALEFEVSMAELRAKQVIDEKELLALQEKKKNTSKPFTAVDASNLDVLTRSLKKRKDDFPDFYKALVGKQAGQIQSAYSSNMGSLKNQLQLAGIVDPYAEQKQKYMQGDQSEQQADEQVKMQKQLDTATRLRDSYRELASTIGTSFGDAFKGIITGSMTAQEALAGFFQNIGNYFVDMVAKMVAEWAKTQVLRGFQSLLGGLGGMFGGGGSSGFFGAGAPDAVAGGGIFSGAGPYQFANGGIAAGGFRAFATGGIVTGPTLGLVGEGRYNEAVIPLPDGKSVPVDLGGMSGGANSSVNVVVNVDAKGSTVEGDKNGAKDLGRAISAAVQSELVKQQRPGGLLASTRR